MKFLTASKGFSVIELMVVIAIVTLLAIVAIPYYRDYSHKAKMAEVKSMISSQLDVWAEKNILGTTETITQPNPDKYISSITLSFTPEQNVTAVLNNSNLGFLPNDVNVIFTPSITSNSINWSCVYTSGDNSNLDAYFQSMNCACSDCPA